MSKRLQVLFDEQELEEIQAIEQDHHMTVAEWVRQTLRAARQEQPLADARRKLHAVEKAAEHTFPVGDIGQILAEIERGYDSGDL